MSVAPIRPINTAPLLGLTLFKIRRTPTARLGLVYRLLSPPGCPRRIGCHCHSSRIGVSTRDLRPEFCPQGNIVERPLGKTLLVERLALGGIIGTPLVIGCSDSVLVTPSDPPERLDVWV